MEFLTNFLGSLTSKLPGVIGAVVVLFVGLIVAGMVGRLVTRLLAKTTLDNKILGKANLSVKPEEAVGKLVYYLLVLMVLMAVLEMLGISNVLEPLKNMAGKFFAFVPNVIAAGVIGYAGYILATIVSSLVTASAEFFTKLSARFGFSSEVNLIGIVRQVVFIVVFIPILIAALDALNITAISEPAKAMLSTFINAIPNIIATVLIIGAFFIGGKYVSTLLKDVLSSLSVDSLGDKLGLGGMFGSSFKLSKLIADLAFFFIVLTGVMTGIDKLGFTQLTVILNTVLEISGKLVFGLAIMAVGTFASNIIFNALAKSEDSKFMASIARVAALSLFLAMGLRAMGIANDIVNLAFGLLLGAVSVAIAVAFGIGGKETAGRIWSDFYNKIKK